MIYFKQKEGEVQLNFIRKNFDYDGCYALVFQNTLTKKIWKKAINYSASPSNSLYLTFVVNLEELEEGEYQIFVFENPHDLYFLVDDENVPANITRYIRFIIAKEQMLTKDDFFLVVIEENTTQIKPIFVEMMRIGDYKTETTTYNNQQKFIVYGK